MVGNPGRLALMLAAACGGPFAVFGSLAHGARASAAGPTHSSPPQYPTLDEVAPEPASVLRQAADARA